MISLQRELDVAESAAEEAKRSAEEDASRNKEALDALRASAAEDLGRCERELREKSERCHKLETELGQVMWQLDGPGAYLLASDVDVYEAPARGSLKMGRLPAGEEVHVLEVVHRKAEKRIRGRVAGGWISLLDTSEGYRWAHRQLAATNEWIGFWAGMHLSFYLILPAFWPYLCWSLQLVRAAPKASCSNGALTCQRPRSSGLGVPRWRRGQQLQRFFRGVM